MKLTRLNLNKGAYLGEKPNIKTVLSECIKNAKKHRWEIKKIIVKPNLELLVLKRFVSSAAKIVYISSGIHGDEPAGPLALAKLLKQNLWPKDLNLYILPCLNPTGCKLHTRENKDGKDLNRDYLKPKIPEVVAHTKWLKKQSDFNMSICVHEDWEANGFYIYGTNKTIAKKISTSVKKVFPIEKGLADGRPTKNGVVDVSYRQKLPFWPEAFFLRKIKKTENFTFETSSDFKLTDRVNAHMVAINTALKFVH